MLDNANKGGTGSSVTNEIMNFQRQISSDGVVMDLSLIDHQGQGNRGNKQDEHREETVEELL